MVAALRAVGTPVESASTAAPAWPTHFPNDIGLLIIESAGGEPATLTTANGFTAAPNSPQATGATTNGTRVTVFWCRAWSHAMAAPTIADPGNHVYAVIVAVSGGLTFGDPFDQTAGGVKAAADATFSIPGFTTTVDNTYVVAACARDTDSASAAFSGSNASLTGFLELNDAGTALGTGGGLGVYGGTRAVAGTVSATTGTVASSINAMWSCAIKSEPDYRGTGAAGGRVVHYEGFDLADGSAVTALPVGQWTATTTGGTAEIRGSGLRCYTAGVSGGFAEGAAAAMGYPLPIDADWELQYEFVWALPSQQSFVRAAFGDTVGLGGIPSTGVAFEHDGVTAYLLRRIATAQTTIASIVAGVTANRRYRVRFRRVGTSLYLKYWALYDPEPAEWTLQAHGESAGIGVAYQRLMFGILGGSVAGVNVVTFDNVYVSNLDRAGRRVL